MTDQSETGLARRLDPEGDEEIVLRNMDRQTARMVIDDITAIGIKREVIRVEP